MNTTNNTHTTIEFPNLGRWDVPNAWVEQYDRHHIGNLINKSVTARAEFTPHDQWIAENLISERSKILSDEYTSRIDTDLDYDDYCNEMWAAEIKAHNDATLETELFLKGACNNFLQTIKNQKELFWETQVVNSYTHYYAHLDCHETPVFNDPILF